jgi:hypothetical protein
MAAALTAEAEEEAARAGAGACRMASLGLGRQCCLALERAATEANWDRVTQL